MKQPTSEREIYLERRWSPRVGKAAALFACGVILALFYISPSSAGGIRASPRLVQLPPTLSQIKTVFVIVMENQDWSSIKNNPDAPYINRTLLSIGAHTEQYFTPSQTVGSLSNYLWLEAGTDFGEKGIGPPAESSVSSTAHLVTQLDSSGISWRTYQEGIAGDACPLTDTLPYVVRHNPFVYFRDVTDGGVSNSPNCIAHVRPLSELTTDLSGGAAARYNFITPNLCDDMHDSCAPLNSPVRQGDTWLSRALPPILNSTQYRSGGAIFITWDEGNIGGPIGMIVLSPYAKPGYANSISYTHSATLRTVQEIFGVRPFLGAAAQANDLADLFAPNLFASSPTVPTPTTTPEVLPPASVGASNATTVTSPSPTLSAALPTMSPTVLPFELRITLARASVKVGQWQTVRVHTLVGARVVITLAYPGGVHRRHVAISGDTGPVSWRFRQPAAAKRGLVHVTATAINSVQRRSVTATYRLR